MALVRKDCQIKTPYPASLTKNALPQTRHHYVIITPCIRNPQRRAFLTSTRDRCKFLISSSNLLRLRTLHVLYNHNSRRKSFQQNHLPLFIPVCRSQWNATSWAHGMMYIRRENLVFAGPFSGPMHAVYKESELAAHHTRVAQCHQ